MRNFLLAAVSLFFFSGYAQTATINDFQYVIVPRKFDFQNSDNQYRLNTLVKFLLEKEGFVAFLDDNLPEELVKEPCNALRADVENNSSLFTTKLVFALYDCYGNAVFKSEEGRSKIKEYEPSFHEAFRKSFAELQALQYAYVPKSADGDTLTTPQVVAAQEQEEQVEMQESAAMGVAASDVDPDADRSKVAEVIPVLYAQAIENGYQLVDTTPALRFKLKKTSRENTFALVGLDGLLFLNDDGNWVAEYYKNGELVTEVFQIKF
ncbi:hypothetical protein [Robertkochia sediminum]|uniref:hypothetical protein n=1 Tax=Robertkochia sediminum TaxID=2785326 RepID=UPI001932E70F|nr:hypothetical protein [Robertkochia sediminum]MBL7472826.1 hypothetical protein [Robertkochia sediminum]